MHFVNEPFSKELPHGGGPTAKPDIFPVGGVCGSLKCAMDTFRNEMERGTAVHNNRFARVVGEHEYGSVIRRGVTPPPPPPVRRAGGPAPRPQIREGGGGGA